MKTKEQMLIDGIKEKLAQDSSSAAKQHAGIDYADFFYSTYDTGFENQKICIERMTGILGLDYDSCVKIQDPVRALYKAVGVIGVANEHIEQLHRDVSGIIQGQLLSHPPKQTPILVPAQVPVSIPQTTSTKQVEQNKYIAEFTSQFGMDEINSDILLTRLKTSTGAWPTRESKNIVKTHYGNWFQGNYGMDTANVKILDVRCIKIFQAPKDHNLTLLTLTNYVLDDSYSPYIADMLKGNNCPNLKVFNLSNNHFTDSGVRPIADAVGSGGTPSLRVLDVHGINTTKTGDGYFAKALQHPMVKDILVLIKKLNDDTKLSFGTKGQKIEEMQHLLNVAKESGVDVKHIVIDKNFSTRLKNEGAVGGMLVGGFAKCHWNIDEFVESYAKGKLIAKLPKNIGNFASKALSLKSAVSCYIQSSEAAWTSEYGVQELKTELELIGVDDLYE